MTKKNLGKISDLMSRVIRIGVVLAAAMALLTPGSSVSAENDLEISNITHAFEFGKTLEIRATLLHPELTSSITLIIQPDAQQSRQIVLAIETNGELSATYDLAANGFTPFSRVYYWFEATLKDGTTRTSASYWFDYLDNRYEWKSNATNLFTIYWVEGDAAYGQKLQTIARSGMEQSTQLLPIVPEIPVVIYVYPDAASMQMALSLDSQAWVNGHTYLNNNIILVSDSNSLADTTDLERVIPHEVMHLLQFQLTSSSYTNAPHWLLEGLATRSELYANPDLEREITNAINSNSLIPLSELCFGFPKDAQRATLAYAQSASLVSYIQKRFGNQVFLSVFQNSAAGKDCEQATSSVLGISVNQLETDWKADTDPSTDPKPYALALWIGTPLLVLIAGITVWTLRRRQVTHSAMKE